MTIDEAIAIVQDGAEFLRWTYGDQSNSRRKADAKEMVLAEVERLRSVIENLLADMVRVNITLGDIQMVVGLDRRIKDDLATVGRFIDQSVQQAEQAGKNGES